MLLEDTSSHAVRFSPAALARLDADLQEARRRRAAWGAAKARKAASDARFPETALSEPSIAELLAGAEEQTLGEVRVIVP